MTRPDFYNPAAFRVDDVDRLGGLIDATVFGTLLCNGEQGPLASHVPFLLDRQAGPRGTLRAHLARVNEHWRVLDGTPALAIFHGPAHYVTPNWYASKAGDGRVVPTWNYVVVHARGHTRVHHDGERLRALVELLTNHLESSREQPWRVDDAPGDFVAAMVERIVGVDLLIEHVEGKLKLGQNRPAGDRRSLAAGLQAERPELWDQLRGLAPPGADD